MELCELGGEGLLDSRWILRIACLGGDCRVSRVERRVGVGWYR